MSGIGREAFPDVREWSGRPRGCPGVVGRPSRMSGNGREALRMSGIGRKALQDDHEWSRGSPGCPGLVGRPSRMSGSGREALPDVREWLGGPP